MKMLTKDELLEKMNDNTSLINQYESQIEGVHNDFLVGYSKSIFYVDCEEHGLKLSEEFRRKGLSS